MIPHIYVAHLHLLMSSPPVLTPSFCYYLKMAVTLNRPGGDAAPAEMSLLAVLIAPFGEALAATVGKSDLIDEEELRRIVSINELMRILLSQATLASPISTSHSILFVYVQHLVGRQELLAFLSLYAEAFHPPIDCTDLPTPLVIAMQDKTAAVRSLAESLLGVLNARALISKTALDKATRDLAPAAKRTLMPSVERMIGLYGSRKTGGAIASLAGDEESVGTLSTAGTIRVSKNTHSEFFIPQCTTETQ